MSSRKGAKAKPGAGKATKKKQPAQKASQVPAKNPSTSTSKKSDKPSSDRFDSDQSPVSPASDLQGRGDKKKGTSEAKAVGSQYSTSHIPSQPLMYALKKTESQENPFIPTSEVPRGPANQMVLQQKPSMTSRKYEQTVFNQSGKREGDEALPPNNLFRHEEGYHSAIASQLTEAIASGLAQADASFQTKTNLLQQMIETSNKKTERAVGQVCHSVNRVKINLEIVDSTLEMMNTRLLEFQQGVRSGLKELTKEVGNLAFSLAQKATGNQKNLNELCANNQQADEVCFNQPFPGPTWYSS